jgi:hypothetical protein
LLGFEAILSEVYGKGWENVPNISLLNSKERDLGVISNREALIRELRGNLALAAKYILGVSLLPYQVVILQDLWIRRFPMVLMSRGAGKTFILGVYAALRAALDQGTKVVLVGAALRQSKFIFDVVAKFWESSPIFREICKSKPANHPDKCELRVGDSFIIAIPLGHDGTKIRGLRATHILADEFAAIPEEPFQVVVRGFAAVTKDPARNVYNYYKQKFLKEKGVDVDLGDAYKNQIVLSGTAYYKFNHYYKMYENYLSIIQDRTQGQVQTEEGIVEDVDYRDYSVIKLPYDAIPPTFMDMAQILNAKKTMHPHLFDMEYGAEFCGTSNGFFPMLDIENATAGNIVKTEDGITKKDEKNAPIKNPYFSVELSGDDGIYVMGADPARENDNFAVAIIKVVGSDYRLVYVDAWRRRDWGYSTDRIRDLINRFNIQRIALDKGGGGETIYDLLRDEKYRGSEPPILCFDDEEDLKIQGMHILEMVNFRNYEWYNNANFDMQGDIHHRRLLFPAMYQTDEVTQKYYGNPEDLQKCYENIAECRNETSQIEISATAGGKNHFDLPKSVLEAQKMGTAVVRKDRYSALLLAAYAARSFVGYGEFKPKITYVVGGWASDFEK